MRDDASHGFLATRMGEVSYISSSKLCPGDGPLESEPAYGSFSVCLSWFLCILYLQTRKSFVNGWTDSPRVQLSASVCLGSGVVFSSLGQ